MLILQSSSVFWYRLNWPSWVPLWIIRSQTALVQETLGSVSLCFTFLWCVQVYCTCTFSSALCTTLSFSSVITFLHVYYLTYAEASSRLALLFWNRNWICMKYAHTKLHLTLGGGNTWQSPLPEMIVLRKTLDDDDVDEVFFCAEIECQKDRRRLAFYTHFFFSPTISSLCHSAAYSDTPSWKKKYQYTNISTLKLDYDKMLCNLNVNVLLNRHKHHEDA